MHQSSKGRHGVQGASVRPAALEREARAARPTPVLQILSGDSSLSTKERRFYADLRYVMTKYR